MSPPKINPVRNYGASIILKHASTLEQLIQPVQEASDIEAIHDMRVASRRLRNALGIFEGALPSRKYKFWQENVQEITRALGAARDCDVQIECVKQFETENIDLHWRPGIRRLLLRLSQKRARLQENVLQALRSLEKQKVIPSLSERLTPFSNLYHPAEPFDIQINRLAFQTIDQRITTFLSYEPFIHDPECVKELHAMRIAAKRLRYSIEAFSILKPDATEPLIKVMKSVQDLLGSIHDCDVWIVDIPEFIQKEQTRTMHYYGYLRPMKRLLPGITLFLENRKQLRNELYKEYLLKWDEWNAEQLWQQIHDVYHTYPAVETYISTEGSE